MPAFRRMLRPKDYIIEFNKLRTGENQYEFVINTEFIQSVDTQSPLEANVMAYLLLFKTETMYDLKFLLKGKVKTTCDVCLDEFEMPVNSDFNLILKISETERYDDDEIVYITPQSIDYDLRQYLYECLVLSIPIKKTCSLGNKDCNAEIMQKLKEVQTGEDADTETGDPRWDKLKGMFN